MRFDDSLYRMLGSELEALDDETDWILNTGTYGGRSVETSRVPCVPMAPSSLGGKALVVRQQVTLSPPAPGGWPC